MVDFLNSLLGLGVSQEALTLYHFTARAFLIYFVGMFLIRIQSQFMGINTPFTFMLNFIMGSVLASAIVGDAPYVPVVITSLFIALMNWFIALLCFYSISIKKLFKGEPDLLVKDGKIIWKNMRKNLITKDELMEAVHKELNSDDLSNVKKAYFEDSGDITIIKK